MGVKSLILKFILHKKRRIMFTLTLYTIKEELRTNKLLPVPQAGDFSVPHFLRSRVVLAQITPLW
jgi:hypothetical protein